MTLGRVSVLTASLGSLGMSVASFGCSSAPGAPPMQGTIIDQGMDGGGTDAKAGEDAISAVADGAPNLDAAQARDAADGGDATADAEDGAPPVVNGPPPPAAVCSQTAMWGAGTELPNTATADANLGAITPDELTIAWTSGSGSSATIAYADRAAETDAFGPPQTLSASSFANDRVALSPDGLRLVVVNGGGSGFSELTRAARMGTGSAFGAPAPGSYSNFDMPGVLPTVPPGETGESFGDPVLSADDNAFYYSLYGRPGQTATIYRSARLLPTDAWPIGKPLPASPVLAQQGSSRRRPTAISADEQTLFYWDEVSTTERAVWIDTSTGVFTQFVDLASRRWANPNRACTRLYYSDDSNGATPFDLFVAAD